jgi:hypothetical protein
VVEIRNRIAAAVGDAGDAAAVRIATLDSHAWALQSGFSSDAALGTGFDDNIERTLQRVRDDEEMLDYLRRVRHLIVDEAQDIVGVRADLTLAIVDALDDDCGVTVFADEAQAIYGFTEESDQPVSISSTLPDRLRSRGFQEISLQRVHRTSRTGLKSIFTSVRAQVIRHNGRANTRRQRIDHEIRRLADEDAGGLRELRIDSIPDGALVLMRNRAEVLFVSSLLAETPHRLRMSGLPSCIRPWIGALLWDHVDVRLTQSEFEKIYPGRTIDHGIAAPPPDAAWRMLIEVAGETQRSVDLRGLREVLSRPAPPMLFCTPEFGEHGPVLGTIHASKGREADEVLLYLPPIDQERDEGQDVDEEIRVMFVGATRVREYLRVGTGADFRAGNVDGRCWRWLNKIGAGGDVRKRVQIEVGRSDDLDAAGLVGRRAFPAPADAEATQLRWLQSPIAQSLHARSDRALDWEFVVEDKARQRVALLSRKFKWDLLEMARQCDRFPPPGFVPHLRSNGARTLVARPDDPQLEMLHEPWRSSGFLLAPLLIGFSPASFRGSSGGH